MDNSENGTNRPDGIVMQARPTPEGSVMVPSYILRTAIANAERAASDMADKIRDAEAERDNYVRLAGNAQRETDRLRHEHASRTAHMRALLACRGG